MANDRNEVYKIGDIDLSRIHTDIVQKFVCIDDSGVVYHGQECVYKVVQVYEYRGYYIIFSLIEEGMEDEFFHSLEYQLKQNSQRMKAYLDENITMVKKTDFNPTEFVSNHLDKLADIARFYREVYEGAGKEMYLAYVANQY